MKGLEREVEDRCRRVDEGAGAPERRVQREAHLGGPEPRLNRPELKQTGGGSTAAGHHCKTQVAPRPPLPSCPLMKRTNCSAVVGPGGR